MSINGTIATYNNVSLYGCHTRRFSQQPVYDQSGTDLLYHNFLLRVVGYVHGIAPANYGYIGVSPPAGNTGTFEGDAPDMLSRIRYRLSEPRRSFVLTMGGTTVLECHGFEDSNQVRQLTNRDLNNGPKPRFLDVTHIAGANVFRIEFEIELAKLGCGDGEEVSNNGSGVLSNRWSCSDELDRQFMTTRTYQGRLRTVSALISPNSFRDFVLPVLQKGFRRERMTFTVSADNLEMDYTVVDREVHLSAPFPATEFEMTHTELTGDAMQTFGECHVRLAGDRSADHRDLITLAARIVDAKLQVANRRIANDAADQQVFVENYQVTDIDGTNLNEVQIRARVRRVAADDPFIGRRIGRPLSADELGGYDPLISKEPDFNELLPIAAAFSCAMQAPCNGDHQFAQAALSPEPEETAQAEFKPEVDGYQLATELSEEKLEYPSEAHQKNAYSFYQADSEYHYDSGKVQLPISNSSKRSELGSRRKTSAVVSLSPPTARRVLRVKAERYGNWPELPKGEDFEDDNGIEYTLLRFTPMPGARDRGPDGKLKFRSEGEYVWAMSRPLEADEKFLVGILPWDRYSVGDHYTSRTAFQASESSLTIGSGSESGDVMPADQS